jgi:hypothetical protein
VFRVFEEDATENITSAPTIQSTDAAVTVDNETATVMAAQLGAVTVSAVAVGSLDYTR